MPPKSKRAKSSEQAIPSTTVDSDVDSPHSSWSEEVDDSNTTDSDSDDGSSTSSTSSVDSQMMSLIPRSRIGDDSLSPREVEDMNRGQAFIRTLLEAGGSLEIRVDFEARAINDDDYHGISRLLRQVFLKSNIDVCGLTNLVIEQADHVGSTIKVCDDDDLQASGSSTECIGEVSSGTDSDGEQVYGVTSLISLAYHQDKPCVKQVKELLLAQCKAYGSSVLSSFSTLLSKRIGLLINERFLNIPSEIAPPLLNGLMVELKEASRKMHDQFSCQYYLLITRSHVPTPVKKRKRKERGKKGNADTGATAAGEDTPMFDYLESELLHKDSVVSFNYPVSEESDQVLGGKWSFDDNAMKPYRTVMVFESQTFKQAVSSLEMNFI